jgi:putative copper resistance protein D
MVTDLLGVFGFLTVILRAVILCAQTLAVGGVFFLLYVLRDPSLRNEVWIRPIGRLVRWSALTLALAQIFFVVVNALVLTSSADLTMRDVLGANFVIAGAFAAAAGLVLFFWPGGLRGRTNPVVAIPALLMLASSVLTSHAASRMEDRALLVTLTTIHYLATATWLGGLPCLVFVMKRSTDLDVQSRVSQRFSRVAQVSVATLLLAGIGMSLKYVGSWSAVYGTAYGVMVTTKAIFLLCLIVLGAGNYFLVRAIASRTNDSDTKISLIRFAEAEIGIGLTIILTAASLTSQPPGVDLPQDRVTMQEITARFSPRMPRLHSPSLDSLSPSSKEMRRKAKAAGRRLPPAFVPGGSMLHINTPGDIAWSEYNHAWAGIVLFVMGILALLSRHRYFRWTRIWPLMFLGLAVFLLLRADPENWPLGPYGFWASFSSPDVLQHRIAVVMIVLFAIFQFGVETGRVKSQAAALVFPAVCALGGALLLTHTHALSNVKEELLAELSHTALAIFAVIAGWSRWLEIRLPESNPSRRYLAWVWPVCFIMIGVLLMDYHEADTAVVVRNISPLLKMSVATARGLLGVG